MSGKCILQPEENVKRDNITCTRKEWQNCECKEKMEWKWI